MAATWLTYRGRRLGPYFRVSNRDGCRQRWIYLGRSEELVDRVRRLLADVQRRRRQRRQSAKLAAQIRASLRRHKARLKEDLATRGIRLKGWEFRGARQGLACYVSQCSSTTKERHHESLVRRADSEATMAGYVPEVSPEAAEGS